MFVIKQLGLCLIKVVDEQKKKRFRFR